MKIIFTLFLISISILQAQTPQGFNYQSVVRDVSGDILSSQNISVQFELHQTTADGTVVYTETHAVITNEYGLFSSVVGQGMTTDDFNAIDWSSDNYFLETSIDLSGGTTYSSMGTTQFLSVPYALHAASAVEIDGDTSNELITNMILNGTDLEITDAGGTTVTSLDSIKIIDGLIDDDGDTLLQVEKNIDEDIIRLTTGGTEYWNFQNGRVGFANTGNSIFIGDGAGENDDLTNNVNIFIGSNAGLDNINSSSNIGVGRNVLTNHTTGTFNVGIGHYALVDHIDGINNISLGGYSLNSIIDGNSNTVIGTSASRDITSGDSNTIIGSQAMKYATTASNNTIIGRSAGEDATGSSNVFIGYGAGKNELGSDKLYIANSTSASPLIYGEFDTDLIRVNGALEATTNALIGSVNLGSESTDQSTSNNSGLGFTTTPWLYTNAIEAQDERGSGSTLITIGDDGTYGDNDEIYFVTDGDRQVKISSDRLDVYGRISTDEEVVMDSDDKGLYAVGSNSKLEQIVLIMNADGTETHISGSTGNFSTSLTGSTYKIEYDVGFLSYPAINITCISSYTRVGVVTSLSAFYATYQIKDSGGNNNTDCGCSVIITGAVSY